MSFIKYNDITCMKWQVYERKIEKIIFISERYFHIKHSYKLLLWYTIDKLSWMSAKSLQLFHFFTDLSETKTATVARKLYVPSFYGNSYQYLLYVKV